MSDFQARRNARTSRRPAPQGPNWGSVLSGGNRRVPEKGARVDTRRPATPPVGQMAVLNGKPVMWKGASGWGTPPSEAMGSGEDTPTTAPASVPIAERPSPIPQGQPSAGRPTPPPSSQTSGAPTPRFMPGPGGSMVSVPPQMPGNPFTPGFGSSAGIGFSRENLARSLAGEGWTNQGVVQQAGDTLGEIALNEKASNPFVSSQFGAPSLLSPSQPAMGTILNAQVQPEGLLAPAVSVTPEAPAPEVAAQSMASDAVNQVMSLQNRIRENRGMPLIVE